MYRRLVNRKKATVLIVEAFSDLAALEFSSFYVVAVCEMQSFLYGSYLLYPVTLNGGYCFFKKQNARSGRLNGQKQSIYIYKK